MCGTFIVLWQVLTGSLHRPFVINFFKSSRTEIEVLHGLVDLARQEKEDLASKCDFTWYIRKHTHHAEDQVVSNGQALQKRGDDSIIRHACKRIGMLVRNLKIHLILKRTCNCLAYRD